MSAFYNEIDPVAAQWLRNLIEAGINTNRVRREYIPFDQEGGGRLGKEPKPFLARPNSLSTFLLQAVRGRGGGLSPSRAFLRRIGIRGEHSDLTNRTGDCGCRAATFCGCAPGKFSPFAGDVCEIRERFVHSRLCDTCPNTTTCCSDQRLSETSARIADSRDASLAFSSCSYSTNGLCSGASKTACASGHLSFLHRIRRISANRFSLADRANSLGRLQ